MPDSAIIIFIKNPEKGKVKTRLAKTIGEDNALSVYQRLLAHTRDITTTLNTDKFLYYSDRINPEDDWDGSFYNKRLQSGSHLGIRMLNAFQEVFNDGYKKVLIIGSDCYQLTTETLNNAFTQLESHDTVIGPTHDGGYYLLGMNRLIEDVFYNKEWSTASVYRDTLHDINQLKLNNYNLPHLSDIDEEKDLPEEWR